MDVMKLQVKLMQAMYNEVAVMKYENWEIASWQPLPEASENLRNE